MFNAKETLFFIVLYAFSIYQGSGGISVASLLAITLSVVFFGLPYYFDSRTTEKPSNFEIILATSYLVFRRLVCFGAALFSIGLALKFMFFSEILFYEFGKSLGLFIFAAYSALVGMYGKGYIMSKLLKDDIDLHAKNNARYKWCW